MYKTKVLFYPRFVTRSAQISHVCAYHLGARRIPPKLPTPLTIYIDWSLDKRVRKQATGCVR